MTDAIREIPLGNEALDYIRESLKSGKDLSAFLLDTLDLEVGRISTFLPAGSPSSQINQFSIGGKLPASPAEKRTLRIAGKLTE